MKWAPYGVSGEYLNFLMAMKGTPKAKESHLDNEDEINKAGLFVRVRAAEKTNLKRNASKSNKVAKTKRALAQQYHKKQ